MNRYGRDYENRSGWMHGGSANAGGRMNHNPDWEGSGYQSGGYDFRGGYRGGGNSWGDAWDARDNNRSGYGAYNQGGTDYNQNDSGYDYGEYGSQNRGWGMGRQQGGWRGGEQMGERMTFRAGGGQGWSQGRGGGTGRGYGMDYDVDYSGRGGWQGQQGGSMNRGGMGARGMGSGGMNRGGYAGGGMSGGGYGGGYGGVNGYRGSGITNLGDRPGNSHFFGYGATFPRGYDPSW